MGHLSEDGVELVAQKVDAAPARHSVRLECADHRSKGQEEDTPLLRPGLQADELDGWESECLDGRVGPGRKQKKGNAGGFLSKGVLCPKQHPIAFVSQGLAYR